MSFEINVNEKLSLKLPKIEEAETIYSAIDKDRDHLRTYLKWVDTTLSPKDTETNILKRIEEYGKKESLQLIAYYENNPIGSVGFISLDDTNNKGEIGYWLNSDFGGKGIMTESVKAIIKYGFEELNLNKIVIKCNSENTKSAAIPQRLGFTLEGTLRDDRLNVTVYADTLVFGLLRREWGS